MKLSRASETDFIRVTKALKRQEDASIVERAAQLFIETVYEAFNESCVLVRLFSTLPLSRLPPKDQQLVREKAAQAGFPDKIHDKTTVLTLLGSRGEQPQWNRRTDSETFRCIPLFSSGYVSSLSMLAAQLQSMAFDLDLLDSWDKVVKSGRADEWKGMLYVGDSENDRDDQGRKIVVKQDFVAEYGVKTSLGFGSGYAHHPTLITLFLFANEFVERTVASRCMELLEIYKCMTRSAVANGTFFQAMD